MKQLLLPLALILLVFGCKTTPEIPPADEAYSAFIRAYTAGHISRTASVRVVFNAEQLLPGVTSGVDLSWIDIEPSIDGELKWSDGNVLEFTPNEWMDSGTAYKVKLDLKEIIGETNLDDFQFGWRTFDQGVTVQVTEVAPYDVDDTKWQYVSGALYTADDIRSDEAEKLLSALQSGQTRNLAWEHESGRTHYFTVDSVERAQESGELFLNWDAATIGGKGEGSTTQEIPGLADFKVIQTTVVQKPEQYINVIFSDPIDEQQSTRGLFILGNDDDVRVEVDGNVVRVYPDTRKTGEAKLEIHSGIKNYAGYRLKESLEVMIQFESLKPAVRMTDQNKTILPTANENKIAFEAVSLSAVDVRVIRIYEDNIPQFLQTSHYAGEDQLKRVGRVVRKKTVDISGQGNDLNQWNRYYLDLDELVKVEPAAIYRIEIGFRMAHSAYPCEDGLSESEEDIEAYEEDWDSFGEEESSYWDYFDTYWYSAWNNYYWDYDYKQRDNPCHGTYYRQYRHTGRNFLTTDIGLTAKRGKDNKWMIVTTDIASGAPLSGASVQLLNYQGQEIDRAVSDADGFTQFEANDKVPFLCIASHNKQKSYLKLANGLGLSLSTFDVSGSATQNGLKGFIYGERGVWRPGDTLFLGFMLEDPENRIPLDHPVKLELMDARNRNVHKENRLLTASNHVSWAIPTDPEAVTGNWQVRIKVGNATFSKRLKVETIKPNRLKIGLDFGKDMIEASDRAIVGDLSVNWLHGAPGRNLRTQIEMTLYPINTSFGRLPDFEFDDPVRRMDSPANTVFDKKVGEDGTASVNINISDLSEAPGHLNAVFNTRAYEAGGDFSIDAHSIPLSPFVSYVGIRLPKGDRARNMLLTDTTHTVQVRTVDNDGLGVARKKLYYTVYKISWKWWWNTHYENLSDYIGRNSATVVTRGEISTNAKGEGDFKFRVDYPSWGRYLVRVEDPESGHATGQITYIDWPGWAGRAQRENPEGETMLIITPDKEEYEVGDQVSISFPGADGARALITVEDGSGIIGSDWIDTKNGSNTYTFKAEKGFAPNVFVSINLIQPYAQMANDKPIRIYGVARVKVSDPATHISPRIEMPDELVPEEAYTVNVSETSGTGMSYTLAVVDEGLLGLTRYKTPNPHGKMYEQEALGVTTWDLFDQVIGAHAGEMAPLLGIGGDEENTESGPKKVNRFKPVVSYLGPFELKAGETAEHELLMPNYIGAVRVMVVARKGSAFGHAEKEVPVRKPLMVLGTLPRVLGPSEVVELPVTVFAMDKNVKDVKVKVKLNGMLEHLGDDEEELEFNKIGDQIVNFRLKVRDLEGVASAEIIATGGGETARHTIELNVRNPNPPMSNRFVGVAEAGQSWSQEFDLIGMEGTNDLRLEVSGFRPIDLGRRLDYLLGYPHGCAEQTTSRAFPQLYIGDAVELTTKQKQRAKDNVIAGIDRLKRFQKENGGFSYWPSQTNINDWATTYVGHFLIEAKDKGFNVPDGMIERWVKYQNDIARNWRPYKRGNNNYQGYELPQAYRLFTLALAGKPNLSAMNRLRENDRMNAAAKWQLAAAYVLVGQEKVAEEITNGLLPDPEAYEFLSPHYGSRMRDLALIAEVMIISGERAKAGPLVEQLADNLSSGAWYSTQETAFALNAIGRFLKEESNTSLKYEYVFNGKSSALQNPQKTTVFHDLSVKQIHNNRLEIENKGERTLYLRLVSSGQPVEDQQPAENNGLELTVVYLKPDGTPLDISQLEQGTDFIAKVQINHQSYRRNLRDVALTQIFPSGWEILNDRMLTAGANNYQSTWAEHKDIRDDRVLTYFNLYRRDPSVFYVRLNAAYVGEFFAPSTQVEVMYDGTINARTQGEWVTVLPAGLL
ncbi:MAG: MG2 domain-containing protein [Flavobacteriales bacterium]|nr:MG2 domain-containing protein [Flavobacteriales bacterium]